jgi:1-deoxy-D-xylulose-5-phosphate reductoisomerase
MALTAAHPDSEPKVLTILGSTGSVGCNTIDLIERNPARYRVEALTANNNVKQLAAQALKLKPSLAVIGNPDHYEALKDALSGSNIEVAAGAEALVAAAARPTDWVMAAIVGAAGLEPALAAIRQGAVLALANKECLVSAGELVMAEVKRCGSTLLPVDSEHNAIFQVFDFDQPESIDRIILTASGGPFRDLDPEVMAHVTPDQAMAHPTWEMGAKISVDSATMMNKGLELIEAYHIFGMAEEAIEIVIHPQSVVHSMVAYVDGSVLAQLGTPDMRTPIAYALGWPNRIEAPAQKLDLATLGQLTFKAPDTVRFPSLRLAREALKAGGAAPTVLNAANEVAVYAFLERQIGFFDIARTVEQVLESLTTINATTISEVIEIDQDARRQANTVIAKLTS